MPTEPRQMSLNVSTMFCRNHTEEALYSMNGSLLSYYASFCQYTAAVAFGDNHEFRMIVINMEADIWYSVEDRCLEVTTRIDDNTERREELGILF